MNTVLLICVFEWSSGSKGRSTEPHGTSTAMRCHSREWSASQHPFAVGAKCITVCIDHRTQSRIELLLTTCCVDVREHYLLVSHGSLRKAGKDWRGHIWCRV